MNTPALSDMPLFEHPLWRKTEEKRTLLQLELEITARCNNNCRHCYINLPADDSAARQRELPFKALKDLIDEAASLGTLWSLITGGEPLLREDFMDIYLYLKKRGMLVSVFTNATLLTPAHIDLFRRYPPRDLEVTVYGSTRSTYERVTRTPGSYDAFRRGLRLLAAGGINVRLKAMALRSNLQEMAAIASFCREHSRDYFRFDPFLHLRLDRNERRNREIRSERLAPAEIATLEQSDPERFQALQKTCREALRPVEGGTDGTDDDRFFRCGIGTGGLALGWDGRLRLCASLCRPDCVYEVRTGSLTDAWRRFALEIQNRRARPEEISNKCRFCPFINLCQWCPASAYLETGAMDRPVDYFCRVAHARAEAAEIYHFKKNMRENAQ